MIKSFGDLYNKYPVAIIVPAMWIGAYLVFVLFYHFAFKPVADRNVREGFILGCVMVNNPMNRCQIEATKYMQSR